MIVTGGSPTNSSRTPLAPIALIMNRIVNSDDGLKPVKWAARLPHVRDVTLLGTADLDYWMRRLHPERLTPVDEAGRARVMIVAADSRFMGIRFREVSVSVAVKPLDVHAKLDAMCLRQAYNSVRFFAFCERKLFQTPYVHAAIRVTLDESGCLAQVDVSNNEAVSLRAELAAVAQGGMRSPSSEGKASWDGAVYLPSPQANVAGDRYFIAEIRGETRTFAFSPDHDRFSLTPSVGDHAVRELVESGFVPQTWAIRADAQHAKSKTYRFARPA